MAKLFSTILIIALFSVFAGCGGQVEENYQMVTLREAGHAGIVSPGFKYGLDSPQFITVMDNIGMVREGNLVEFFTGEDLENKVEMVEGKKYFAGVTKSFSPKVHFVVDFFAMNGDTIRVGEPASHVEYPTLLRGFDEGEYEEVDIDLIDSSTRTLKEIYDTKFKFDGAKVTWEEIQNAQGETVWEYILHFERVKFLIDQDELDEGMELLLKAQIAENNLVSGGVGYGGMPSSTDFPRSYRTRTDIGGRVVLEFLRYAGEVCPRIQ